MKLIFALSLMAGLAQAQENPSAYLNCYSRIQKGVSYGPASYNNQAKVLVLVDSQNHLLAYTGEKVFKTTETFKNIPYYSWNVDGKDLRFVFDQAYDKDHAKKPEQKEFRKINGYGKENILPPYNFKMEEAATLDNAVRIKKSVAVGWDSASKNLLTEDLTKRILSIPTFMKDYPPTQKTKDDLIFQLEACSKTGDPQIVEAVNVVTKKLGLTLPGPGVPVNSAPTIQR